MVLKKTYLCLAGETTTYKKTKQGTLYVCEVIAVISGIFRNEISSPGFDFAWQAIDHCQSQSFDSHRNMDLDVNLLCFNTLFKFRYI